MRIPYGVCAVVLGATLLPAEKPFDPARIDTSVRACDNFFQYANGGWLSRTEIPADKTSTGGVMLLRERNAELLRAILERAAAQKAPEGTPDQLIGNYYGSCMDEAGIEAAGTKPIQPMLTAIAAMKARKELPTLIARLHDSGVNVAFWFGVAPDLKNSRQWLGQAQQGGLTLDNRDYYTKDDAKSKATREEFVAYVARMLQLLGDSPEAAKAGAETVMRVEMRLALASLTPVELRDPEKRYRKVSIEEAHRLTPAFSWSAYGRDRGAPQLTELNVAPASFFEELEVLLGDLPLEDWKTYLRWRLLSRAAPLLPKAFQEEHWRFTVAYLRGAKEREPRWRTCVFNADAALGEALGQAYVKQHFPPGVRDPKVEIQLK